MTGQPIAMSEQRRARVRPAGPQRPAGVPQRRIPPLLPPDGVDPGPGGPGGAPRRAGAIWRANAAIHARSARRGAAPPGGGPGGRAARTRCFLRGGGAGRRPLGAEPPPRVPLRLGGPSLPSQSSSSSSPSLSCSSDVSWSLYETDCGRRRATGNARQTGPGARRFQPGRSQGGAQSGGAGPTPGTRCSGGCIGAVGRPRRRAGRVRGRGPPRTCLPRLRVLRDGAAGLLGARRLLPRLRGPLSSLSSSDSMSLPARDAPTRGARGLALEEQPPGRMRRAQQPQQALLHRICSSPWPLLLERLNPSGALSG